MRRYVGAAEKTILRLFFFRTKKAIPAAAAATAAVIPTMRAALLPPFCVEAVLSAGESALLSASPTRMRSSTGAEDEKLSDTVTVNTSSPVKFRGGV